MEAFRAYALTSSIIAVQMLLLAFYTGALRGKRKQFVTPEDAALNKGELTERDHPDVIRAQRAHMNLLESAVPFFVVGALYVMSGASVRGAQIYCYTFLAARFFHTVFYLVGKQPFRTISFAVGVLAILGMAYHVIPSGGVGASFAAPPARAPGRLIRVRPCETASRATA